MWTYILQGGETLSSLAAKFKTRITALEAANPGIRLVTLKPGLPIHIYGLPSISQYQTKAGDTLDSIAAKFRTDAKLMRILNPDVPATDIAVGQIVNVPDTLDENGIDGENHGKKGVTVEGDRPSPVTSRCESMTDILQPLLHTRCPNTLESARGLEPAHQT